LVCLLETQHVVGTGADSEDCTRHVVVLERETGFEPATFCMASPRQHILTDYRM